VIFTPQPIEFMSGPFEDPYASSVPAETQETDFPPNSRSEYLPFVARLMWRRYASRLTRVISITA